MKMEPIEGSETSAIRTKTPGNYPKKTYYIFKQNFTALCGKLNLYMKIFISVTRNEAKISDLKYRIE